MTDARVKTPWHIWLVGLVAVLFNFIGVFDFVMSMAQGAKYQASAGMTPDQIAHYQQMPSGPADGDHERGHRGAAFFSWYCRLMILRGVLR